MKFYAKHLHDKDHILQCMKAATKNILNEVKHLNLKFLKRASCELTWLKWVALILTALFSL